MAEKNYLDIVSHYESCLERHGDTHRGVDWPKREDAVTRYNVMLEVIRREADDETVSVLDFGCGAAHLYEHMLATGVRGVAYAGLDLSEKFVELSRRKFPSNEFYCVDILDDASGVPRFDYVLMNGVFTEKRGLGFDEMLAYFERLLKEVWEKAGRGLAFNVMSKHVDWEREDLFHLPFDTLAAFLTRELTRNFVLRNDYGLYEYTAYVYR
ncbi:MAG: class I SAM-dependent methyltransferase [Pyrinomonadaceae bacterium]